MSAPTIASFTLSVLFPPNLCLPPSPCRLAERTLVSGAR
jgi:hypothetical protein